MEINFVNAKDEKNLASIKVKSGDAALGLNIALDGSLTKEGIPQHKIYSHLQAVSFGVQRFQKQEERNSVLAVSGQAYMFRRQYPEWLIKKMYRPIYDLNPDDALVGAILDEDSWQHLSKAGTKLTALIAEITEWNANKYAAVKQIQPTLLNNFLNKFPFPFRDEKFKTREVSCTEYYYDQVSWFDDNIETIEPTGRIFPLDGLSFELIEKNDLSALILVKTEKYGVDDLVAQLFFQANPGCARIILVHRLYNSTKHGVSVVNSRTYDTSLGVYSYPNIKELNVQEKNVDGDPGWKNLRITCIGPRKGSSLSFDHMWELSKIK